MSPTSIGPAGRPDSSGAFDARWLQVMVGQNWLPEGYHALARQLLDEVGHGAS